MGLMTISAELSKSATCLGCYVNAWIASAFPVVPLGVSSRSCSFVGIRFCKDTHRSMHFSDILTPARMRGHSRYGLTWLHGQQITAQKFGSGLPSGHHGGAYSAWTVQSSAINVPISFTFEMSVWAPWLMAKWSHPNEMKMEEKTAPKRPSHSVAILKRNTIYIYISMGHGIQRFPMFSRHQLVYDNLGYTRWTGKFNVGFFSLAWKKPDASCTTKSRPASPSPTDGVDWSSQTSVDFWGISRFAKTKTAQTKAANTIESVVFLILVCSESIINCDDCGCLLFQIKNKLRW